MFRTLILSAVCSLSLLRFGPSCPCRTLADSPRAIGEADQEPESSASGNQTAAEPERLFGEKIVPLFASRCASCHQASVAEGGFQITSAEDFFAAGIVEPGDADASYLVELVTSHDDLPPSMPAEGEPLSAEEVRWITDWINQGAVWPSGKLIEAQSTIDRDWWSLRNLTRPTIPQPSDPQGWARNAIDQFILDRLAASQLAPSPEADRSTLIRRLYFDLHGLPPTAEEVERFVHSSDPLAYEKLVERLLASPRYGERWARHWLDIVHYADTHGYDKDKPRENAWPYRDYLVDAFNDDRPYDRFILEQLAGDALWPQSPDANIATGFIAAGPWDFIGHAEVPETKRDGKIARHLDRDDMVTTTMNTFCSLTVQCARCHDHKLDPVSMRDYYRLQAVFAAIDRADRTIHGDPQVAIEAKEIERQLNELAIQQERFRHELEAVKSDHLRDLERQLTTAQIAIMEGGELLSTGAESDSAPVASNRVHLGYHSQVASREDERKWIQVDLGRVQPIEQVILWPAQEWGWYDFGFPPAFHIEVANQADFADGRRVFTSARDEPTVNQVDSVLTETSYGPGDPRPRVLRMEPVRARYLRITATKLWNRRHYDSRHETGGLNTNDWIFALGEIAIGFGDRLIPIFELNAKDSIEAAPRWSLLNATDGLFGPYAIDDLKRAEDNSPTNGFHSQFASEADSQKWVQIDLGRTTEIDWVELIPAYPTDWADTPGFGFPSEFRIDLWEEGQEPSPQTIVYQSDQPSLDNGHRRRRVDFNQAARYVRVTASRLADRGDGKYLFALAELRVYSEGRNIAEEARVETSDSIEAGRWSSRYLVDGFSSRLALADETDVLVRFASNPKQSAEYQRLLTEREQEYLRTVPTALRALGTELARQETQLKERQSLIPTPAFPVYVGAVHAGSGAFRGRAGLPPREIHVLRRGDVSYPLEQVLPGTVPMNPTDVGEFPLPADHRESDRRIALAHWIIRDQHPLTWRSIANRVWQYHIGSGLCATPNDFGRGGELPSHPKLLDWLACELRDLDKSLKHLHRLICTSATYRQTSRPMLPPTDEQNVIDPRGVDSGNRLLWRMNRRRLTAEEIRDSILSATGQLDLTMGGPGFKDFVIEHPEHSPHYEYSQVDVDDRRLYRRSIYRFIVRSQPEPFMTALDCADPAISVPSRDESHTAVQALAMLNNRLFAQAAKQYAEEASMSSGAAKQQIERLFVRLVGRAPDQEEQQELAEFHRRFGLQNTCLVLFNLNEFVFVD